MIFTKANYYKIIEGQKWQTRRLYGDPLNLRRPATVGTLQGIQTNYREKATHQIFILALYDEKLLYVYKKGNGKAEGYPSARSFMIDWCRIHKLTPYHLMTTEERNALWDTHVWVVVFQYAGQKEVKP